jgi:hypothetical protein
VEPDDAGAVQAFEDELDAAAPDDGGDPVLESAHEPVVELPGTELPLHGAEDGVADHAGDDSEEGIGHTGAADDESAEVLEAV